MLKPADSIQIVTHQENAITSIYSRFQRTIFIFQWTLMMIFI